MGCRTLPAGSLQLLFQFFGDPYHREWNDVKAACQRCDAYLWGTLAQLTVVYNLSRGPWNSAAFWRVAQEALEHLLEQGTDTPAFQDNVASIARDMRLPPPTSQEEEQYIFEQLKDIDCVRRKGHQ